MSKTTGVADITRFNKLEVNGKIFRLKYGGINMKFGVWSEYKVFLRVPGAKQIGLEQ